MKTLIILTIILIIVLVTDIIISLITKIFERNADKSLSNLQAQILNQQTSYQKELDRLRSVIDNRNETIYQLTSDYNKIFQWIKEYRNSYFDVGTDEFIEALKTYLYNNNK